MSSYLITSKIKSLSKTDRIITMFTFTLTQIILSFLICGLFFELSLVNLCILSLIILFICWVIPVKKKEQTRFSFTFKSIGFWPWICFLIALVQYVYNLYLIYLLPSFTYDSMSYHLVSAAYWIQQKEILLTPYDIWTNVYPQNAEVVFGWIMLVLGNDTWVELGQMFFLLGGVLAVYGIARVLSFNIGYSVAAASLFAATPLIFVQANTNYVDVAFVCTFLVFLYYMLKFAFTLRSFYCLQAGLAGGIALGIKSSAVAYLAVTMIIVFIYISPHVFKQQRRIHFILKHVILLVIPIGLIGTFWYMRTWYYYGNPIYPFTVEIAGHTIFEGKGSVNDLIMVSNTPKEILDLPWWKKLFISWNSEPNYYRYDQGLGGLGLQWLYCLFPAVLLSFALAIEKRAKEFMLFCIILISIFLIQPSNWWSRYTLSLVPLGTVSLIFLLHSTSFKSLKAMVQSLVVVLTLISTYYAWPHAFFFKDSISQAQSLSPDERTIGKLVWRDFEWIDSLPPSNIGIIRSEQPFTYPLFGNDWRNHVFMLESVDKKETFFSNISTHAIEYMFLKKGTEQHVWASQRFKNVLYENENFTVFQIY
ncbi:ArnT family glycosyltransferase [Paenibacillus xylanexedens]|uniref:ArnT family glycosyltransferase n=1 Tax=Paenibacillus xylanexedens TaxID=528191 RepID=UPI003D05D5AE